MRHALLFAMLILAVGFLAAANNPGYYRFPTIHGNTIVFTAEGDLWVTGTDGGAARRLTSHSGVESYAAVSPDGATVAFSAEYEGPTEVYTMPLTGGVPQRRTFDGNARVVGWSGDGRILYATNRYATLPNAQLLTLELRTGRSDLLPLAQASDGSFDGNGKTLYFTRLAFQGSHTKRYKGGTAQNIWKFTPGDPEAIPLTKDYDGTSKTPLWHNGRVYFATDRDGTMNLWSMNTEGKDLRQHTSHKGWDLKSPSMQGGRIVYQLGADIHLYDIAANTDRLVPITIPSDFDQLREKWVKNPMEYMTSYGISPTGDRIAFTARGQVFVAPAEQGRFVRVTGNNRIRYRQAVFMPDGKTLLALSDETGETEFVTLPANGAGSTQALTSDAKVLRWGGRAIAGREEDCLHRQKRGALDFRHRPETEHANPENRRRGDRVNRPGRRTANGLHTPGRPATSSTRSVSTTWRTGRRWISQVIVSIATIRHGRPMASGSISSPTESSNPLSRVRGGRGSLSHTSTKPGRCMRSL